MGFEGDMGLEGGCGRNVRWGSGGMEIKWGERVAAMLVS